MAERAQGSGREAHQPAKETNPTTAAIFQVPLQGKCVIWEKAWSYKGAEICYQEGKKGHG